MHILETLELVDSPTLIYLIDLRDGTVLDGFETADPSMVYGTHITNSWEEGEEELVLDVATNPGQRWPPSLIWTRWPIIHQQTEKTQTQS